MLWQFKFEITYDPQSLIHCNTTQSPASETTVEKEYWIKNVPTLLIFFDWYCHLYFLRLLRQIFQNADFKYQNLFSSPQCAHVTFFVKSDRFEHAFGLLCSIPWHAMIQVPPEGVTNKKAFCFVSCFRDLIKGVMIWCAVPSPRSCLDPLSEQEYIPRPPSGSMLFLSIFRNFMKGGISWKVLNYLNRELN